MKAKTLKKYQKAEAELSRKLFDLCSELGDGVHHKLHIINTSDGHGLEDEKKEFRIYSADGYCFDISKEPVELSDYEQNDCAIDGYEYQFMEGIYEGFKDLIVEEAIQLLINERTYLRRNK